MVENVWNIFSSGSFGEMAAPDSSTLSPESFYLLHPAVVSSRHKCTHAHNHAGLMRFERAHDRHKFAWSEFEQHSEAMLALKGWRAGARNNHSHSSALAGKLVPDVFNHLHPGKCSCVALGLCSRLDSRPLFLTRFYLPLPWGRTDYVL